MRDELKFPPKQYENSILNLDTGNGTHWVAYKIRKGTVHYFDSFGNVAPPLEFLSYVKSATSLHYNRWRYQHYDSVNCGHLCLAFLSNNLHFYSPLFS